MWSDDWIGIPYQELGRGPDGYDCLGLFLALQRVRHGRDLFDPLCSMTAAARMNLADQVRPKWKRIERAEEGAAVLFRVKGFALHVGYALDYRHMLHASGEAGQSMIEDFTSSNWGTRLEGIYAYAG
ncbi:tail assembly protein, putative [Roseobacter sp. SK209-2-6]|uniref:NlpC/P60 family protein n=1 Tax=Roseobacter sp. SK209-2-6 TaxID=388739 RepID=UPI0000F3C4B7|nr:NlpC/P60 family protein [Roseobacter sp. SK209-2-6]EBA18406.1 tail assembly protein, putative [Roseobacter sp. SK209-2-6]